MKRIVGSDRLGGRHIARRIDRDGRRSDVDGMRPGAEDTLRLGGAGCEVGGNHQGEKHRAKTDDSDADRANLRRWIRKGFKTPIIHGVPTLLFRLSSYLMSASRDVYRFGF